jgi:hypothetical protein
VGEEEPDERSLVEGRDGVRPRRSSSDAGDRVRFILGQVFRIEEERKRITLRKSIKIYAT